MTDRMITAQELDDARISTHRFSEGYDIDEVDCLLDRASYTIRTLETQLQEKGVKS